MKRNEKAEKLVARLLNSDEIRVVGGGQTGGHVQSGSGSYVQDGSCPGAYVQNGAGSYQQHCSGTGPVR